MSNYGAVEIPEKTDDVEFQLEIAPSISERSWTSASSIVTYIVVLLIVISGSAAFTRSMNKEVFESIVPNKLFRGNSPGKNNLNLRNFYYMLELSFSSGSPATGNILHE